jgi:hypothetical protein
VFEDFYLIPVRWRQTPEVTTRYLVSADNPTAATGRLMRYLEVLGVWPDLLEMGPPANCPTVTKIGTQGIMAVISHQNFQDSELVPLEPRRRFFNDLPPRDSLKARQRDALNSKPPALTPLHSMTPAQRRAIMGEPPDIYPDDELTDETDDAH